MRSVVRRAVVAIALVAASVSAATPNIAVAQGTSEISGKITDTAGVGLSGAVLQVIELRVGATANADGLYRLNVPAGSFHIVAHVPGYTYDTAAVTVGAGQTVRHNFVMRLGSNTLHTVTVLSPRLNETKAAALDSMKNAPNMIYVESGDEIRSLPALNAAEAAERIPGVTTERDEGEGKFIQIRGTEPKLQNVTIDGAHIPGTLNGDRSVKLDNVPSDIIGAIEVTKTLTADQDADAIGGSVNIITKIPETAPRGYVSGLFGYTTLRDRNAGQVGFTYGGRVGPQRKFGFLLGASIDRNDRPIDDVEPSWSAQTNSGTGFYPSDFNQRDYFYFRTRYGLDADFDYKPDDQTTFYVRGLWSRFLNHGYRYVWDVGGTQDLGNNIAGGATSYRQDEYRSPVENTYGGTAGFKKDNLGPFKIDGQFNLGGSTQNENNYHDDTFGYTGADYQYHYDNSNPIRPQYQFVNSQQLADLMNPSNFVLQNYTGGTDRTYAQEVGGRLNLKLPYTLGDFPASFKVGASLRNLTKTYDNHDFQYDVIGNAGPNMQQLIGSLGSSCFYGEQFNHCVNLGPFPSNVASQRFEQANPGLFQLDPGTAYRDALSEFAATERVTAGYIMHDVDINRLHVNMGLRYESTFQQYRAYADTNTADANSTSPTLADRQTIIGRHTYDDWFPSIQFRYALDDASNLRLAVTRGIARADYSSLAPTTTGTPNSQIAGGASNNHSVSLGNPNLHAETAWNFDLLGERYLHAMGIVQAGVFYKELSNVIFTQNFANYQGPVTAYQGAFYSQPENGGSGHLAGVEFDWEYHLIFLPGALKGIGFDVNYTHTHSYVVLPQDSLDGNGNPIPGLFARPRKATLPRTSPDLANASLLYNYGPVDFRAAWVYQGANNTSYGSGIRNDAVNGDQYFYAHSQIDLALYVSVTKSTQIQLQCLNANNAVFGFFTGSPQHQYDIQREYYGQTIYAGLRQSF
jgi:TonB-dependent receptor